MSLLEQIKQRKSKLSPSDTIIRTADGKILREKMIDNKFTTTVLSTSDPGYVVDTKPDLQVAKITENLYMGSQDVACDERLLHVNNINHVISLGIHVNRYDNIGYTFVDMLDLPEFDILGAFKEVFDVIDEVVNRNGRVFVHCNAGVSRSGAICVGYLMKSLRLGFQEAYDMVRAVRSCVRPNEGFVRQLRDFERVLNVGNE